MDKKEITVDSIITINVLNNNSASIIKIVYIIKQVTLTTPDNE